MARQPSQTEEPAAGVEETQGTVIPPRQGRQRAAAGTAVATTPQFSFGQQQTNFRIKKHVSVPMLEIPPGVSFVCRIADEVRVLPAIEGHKPRFKDSPHYASTILAPNGEARLFTWTAVFKSEMEKNYPDKSYVGLWFRITKLPMKSGKDYNTYAIEELEAEDEAA